MAYRPISAVLMLVMCSVAYYDAGAKEQEVDVPKQCVQEGGPLLCKTATVGPWFYRTVDLYNDARYPDEASAYAYLLRIRAPESIFSLIGRWGTAQRAGYETTTTHSIETSSWKLYMRFPPGQSDQNAEWMGYQRRRSVACPAGYHFSSDETSPYCLPKKDTSRASSDAPLAFAKQLPRK